MPHNAFDNHPLHKAGSWQEKRAASRQHVHTPSRLCNRAGLDKYLSPAELEVICDHYRVARTPSLEMCDHRSFLHELELLFTVPVSHRTFGLTQ